MTGVMSNVVPIILLILLGYIIRIKGLLKEETMWRLLCVDTNIM